MRCLYLNLLLIVCLLFASCKEGNDSPSDLDKLEELELKPIMNLLTNGNCEEWTTLPMGNTYLSGWSLRNKDCIIKERDVVYEGSYAVCMLSPAKGITAALSQKVKVTSGHLLRLRFHYYIEPECTGTKPRMYCYFREGGTNNIPNDVLASFYDDATWGVIRGGGYGLSSFPLEYGEWQLFDYTIEVPAIADYFVFEIHSYAGTKIYVDDCWVVDIDMYK